MVGGEGGEVLDGVLRGLVADQDCDLGYPDGLGDALRVHKLLVGVVGYLVINWRQPEEQKLIKLSEDIGAWSIYNLLD